MLIPGSHDQVAVFCDRLQDIRKFTGIEAVTIGELDLRFEPDLGITAAALDMNVDRLGRLPSFEKK
jgi:hypothetical protein